MSILQGGLSYSDFYVTGVFTFIVTFILQGCPSYRVVYLMIFVLYSHITLQGGIPNGVSALQGCPPYIGVECMGCPLYRGVYLNRGST